MTTSVPQDRMLQFYLEFQNLYQTEEKKLHEFWRRTVGGGVFGWTFFLWGHAFGRVVFINPPVIAIYFFLALLIGVKGIEKGREIDRILNKILFKGGQVEKKLKQRGEKGFTYFAKKRKIGRYLLRIFPFFFIIYPLVNLGLSPLFLNKFFCFGDLFCFIIEILSIILLLFVCCYWILYPYWELNNKYKKLAAQ